MNENAVSTVTVSDKSDKSMRRARNRGNHARHCGNVRASKTSKRGQRQRNVVVMLVLQVFYQGSFGRARSRHYSQAHHIHRVGWLGGGRLTARAWHSKTWHQFGTHVSSISGPRHGRTVRVGKWRRLAKLHERNALQHRVRGEFTLKNNQTTNEKKRLNSLPCKEDEYLFNKVGCSDLLFLIINVRQLFGRACLTNPDFKQRVIK